jgi:cytochrome oxidase Cu insertion factor (SCO1/SenC/PrrC family)
LRNPIELADQYVAVWNEPSEEARRKAVAELWAEDAVHLLQPPEEVVKAAAALDITAVFQSRGHDELCARVGRAYAEFVASGQMVFRRRGEVGRVHDAVRLGWEGVSTSDGTVVAHGTNFVILDADGRIRLDYQFVEA